jgi:predicted TIM-barrel fold metal-dependent hydrolase
MTAMRSPKRAPIRSGANARSHLARRLCAAGAAQPHLRGLAFHPQLPELADLASAYPQTTIILNHVGGPLGIGPYKDKKAETFAQGTPARADTNARNR